MAPTGSSTSSTSTSSTATADSASSASADQDMFLQLLVAQLENQDPLNPVDGTTFVTQLAEFQQLDETMSIGGNVSSILTDLNTIAGVSNSATDSTGSTNGAAGAVTNS